MQILSGEHPAGDSPRSRIYRHLYETKDFCSRQMLAAECGVSMPTLYQNLTELMQEGLVRYSGEERATGGRRAQGLELVPDARVAVGLSVTERRLRMTAVDLRLSEIAYRVLPFDLVAQLKENRVRLAQYLEEFLDDYRIDRGRLLGVGITIPGLITWDRSQILAAPTMNLRNVPLERLIRDIPYPVNVENDGSSSGYAEYFAGGRQRNLAYFSLENGVGGAVIVGGEPYLGTNNRSGEFGHICVEPGGLRCSCGKRGCLEAYCSPRRIHEEFGVSLADFFRGVEEHNPEYETLLHDMLRHLAIAVNIVRLVLGCDIVLGGYLTEFLQPYLPVLQRYVRAGSPFDQNADFLRLSTLRRHIAPMGAALHFVQAFISGI